MANQRESTVVIDPVTRIEGHLRIQATATKRGGKYLIQRPALSSSTMVRGVEIIMKDRDPRDTWAFAQRICGVCTVVHGLTSVRAVENAAGIKVPKNADWIRNLMIGAQYVHDHVMHFYHLHALDWVDVVSALSADPAKTAELARSNNPDHRPNGGELPDAAYFQNILDQLNGLKARNQLGLFSNGYWGHPAYKLSPEANLALVSHYLEGLAWARGVVRLHAIFGGKDPHPDLLVGGMQSTFSVPDPSDPDSKGTAVDEQGFSIVQETIGQMRAFVDAVYLPDVVFLARAYRQWANYGASAGNFLSFGEFPEPGLVQSEFSDGAIDHPDGYLIPQGVLWRNNLHRLARFDERHVTENVAHAWYQYSAGVNLHPSVGETTLNYTGPAPDQDDPEAYMLNQRQKYSWIKSPRYRNKPMEVGPLAHILIMHARGTQPTDRLVRRYVETYWQEELKLPFRKLNSTLGRIFCRAIETKIIADKLQEWKDGLYGNRTGHYSNPEAFQRLKTPSAWPQPVGFGFTEAPRGALGHWVSIDPTTFKVANYQCIVASQWNAGPRDARNVEGPYERSLKGHVLADPTQPLEVLRTIHSFDPCIGCAVHIVDPKGRPLVQVDLNHANGLPR